MAISDATLMLTPLQHSDTLIVTIVDDEVSELSETFKVNLNFSGEPVPFVKLYPSTSSVIIIDNDEGKVMINATQMLKCLTIIGHRYFIKQTTFTIYILYNLCCKTLLALS